MIDRWMPAAASGHAGALDAVLVSVHAHMLLIFVAWLALFVIALVKFRKGANPEPRSQGVKGAIAAIAIGAVIVGDVIILATGFDAQAFVRPAEITGIDGATLDDAWSNGPRAYRTTALPGFPNFFMIMGPNSPVGRPSSANSTLTRSASVVTVTRTRDCA